MKEENRKLFFLKWIMVSTSFIRNIFYYLLLCKKYNKFLKIHFSVCYLHLVTYELSENVKAWLSTPTNLVHLFNRARIF